MDHGLAVRRGEKILFAGDSITDCEHRGIAAPLGFGYVQLVDSLIKVHRPDLALEVVNRGNAGDTILDLEARWTRDVLEERPDTLFIMIGVNDVLNRYVEEQQGRAVSDNAYRAAYRKLVGRTREEIDPRMVLLEPTCLELALEEPPNRDLGRLARIVAEVGEEFDLPVLPVFQRLSSVVASGPSGGWYTDFPHPGFPGHALIALTILEHLGLALAPPRP